MLVPKQPRYIQNYEYDKGIILVGGTLHGRDFDAFKKRLGVDEIKVSATFPVNSYFRMLAKMAYGMIILEYGSEALEECYVLPCIMGKTDDIGYWVGSSEQDVLSLPKVKEFHLTQNLRLGNEVRAKIRLFANFQTPEYLVIVGRLKKGV